MQANEYEMTVATEAAARALFEQMKSAIAEDADHITWDKLSADMRRKYMQEVVVIAVAGIEAIPDRGALAWDDAARWVEEYAATGTTTGTELAEQMRTRLDITAKCNGITFLGEANVGSDAHPEVGIYATCNDSLNDCGFQVKHVEEGHSCSDWLVTSDVWRGYEAQHLEHRKSAR